MIQNVILLAILAGAVFFTVRYLRRTLAGKGLCCSDSCVNCPIEEKGPVSQSCPVNKGE